MTAHKISPHLKDLQPPAGMGNVQAWLCWRSELKEGASKPSKIPYYANKSRRNGKQGTPEDRDQLVTFDAAKAAAMRHGFTGVGFAVLPGSNVVALDFDDVVQDEDTLRSLTRALEDTYAEFSPSGNGVRAFVMQATTAAPLSDEAKKHDFVNLKSHAKNGNAFTFEVFATSGFVTFTGNVLDPTAGAQPVAYASDKIRKLYESRLAKRGPVFGKGGGAGAFDASAQTVAPIGYSIEELHNIVKGLNPSASYDDWIEVGMCLHHETGGSQDGFEVWHEWSSTGDSYVSEGDCEYHWLSFNKTDGAKTMRTLLKRANAAGAKVGSPVATADDFDDMTGESGEDPSKNDEGSPPDRFALVQCADYIKRPSIGWLVKGLIQAGDPCNLFGPSGSGKSFVALDIGMAIAQGVPWRGLKTTQGTVVYICAEGAGGFRTRLDAYCNYHQVNASKLAFHVIPAAPSLLKPKDVKEVIAVIAAANLGPVATIVVDTLAQTTSGADENSGEDMGPALTAVQTIGAAFSTTVVLVHHTGKDVNRGARGWSGIKGAMGTQLEVIQTDNGGRALHVEKLKDGEGGATFPFKLHSVKLGKDADGDEISSCVVLPAGETTAGRPSSVDGRTSKVGDLGHLILDTATALEMGAAPVSLPELIAGVVGRMDPEPDAPPWRARARVKEAIAALVKRKLLGHIDGVYFTPGENT